MHFQNDDEELPWIPHPAQDCDELGGGGNAGAARGPVELCLVCTPPDSAAVAPGPGRTRSTAHVAPPRAQLRPPDPPPRAAASVANVNCLPGGAAGQRGGAARTSTSASPDPRPSRSARLASSTASAPSSREMAPSNSSTNAIPGKFAKRRTRARHVSVSAGRCLRVTADKMALALAIGSFSRVAARHSSRRCARFAVPVRTRRAWPKRAPGPPPPPAVAHARVPGRSGLMGSAPHALGAVAPVRCASAAAAGGNAPEGPGTGRRARERLERYQAERQRFMKYDIMQHANLEPALSKDPKAPIAVKITMRRFKRVEHGSWTNRRPAAVLRPQHRAHVRVLAAYVPLRPLPRLLAAESRPSARQSGSSPTPSSASATPWSAWRRGTLGRQCHAPSVAWTWRATWS